MSVTMQWRLQLGIEGTGLANRKNSLSSAEGLLIFMSEEVNKPETLFVEEVEDFLLLVLSLTMS